MRLSSWIPHKGYKGCKKRAFSIEARLLIKNYQCMKEGIKLIVFLAQKSRHIVEACGRK